MFTREYWASSFAKFKSVRYLAIMAFLIAMRLVLDHFRLPISENLNIMFTFVPTAVEAMIVGPGAAMISGFAADMLTGTLSAYGPFFPGYTLSKILGGLILGLAFYRTRITWRRILIGKGIINYLVNVCLGSLWSSILYSKGFLFYASASLIKNTILLPVEVVILYLLFKSLIPILQRRGLIRDTSVSPR